MVVTKRLVVLTNDFSVEIVKRRDNTKIGAYAAGARAADAPSITRGLTFRGNYRSFAYNSATMKYTPNYTNLWLRTVN